jgi:hypothetical protein
MSKTLKITVQLSDELQQSITVLSATSGGEFASTDEINALFARHGA